MIIKKKDNFLKQNINYLKQYPDQRYRRFQDSYFFIVAIILTKKQLYDDAEFNNIFIKVQMKKTCKIYERTRNRGLMWY